MKLKIDYIGTFYGERKHWWSGQIWNEEKCLSESVQMAGTKLTREDAIADAKNFAELLGLEIELPSDPCL